MKRRIVWALLVLGLGATVEAAIRTWDGGGVDNNWSTADNWDGGIPGLGDTAQFNGTSTKDAVVDVAYAAGLVDYLTVASGYTGTITLDRSLTVRMTYSQADGTFTAGANGLTVGASQTVNWGHFTLSGGVFNSPTGTLTINGQNNTVAQTGGTFNHNNGTVLFNGINTTVTIPNMTFYNLTVNQTGNYSVYFNSGTTNVVLGDLDHARGYIRTGTLELRGNLSIGSLAVGGNGMLRFVTGGDQTITGTGGTTCGMYINKPSGSVSAFGDMGTGQGGNGLSANFTLAGGTFNSTSNTFTFKSYNNAWTLSGGTFNHNNGTVAFTSYQPNVYATNQTFCNLVISTPRATAPNNSLILPKGGVTNVLLGDLIQTAGGIRYGTLDLRGNMTIGPGALGSDGVVAFYTAGDQTIYCSTGATCSLLVDKPSGSVTTVGGPLLLRAIGAGAVGGHFTLANGTFNGPTNEFVIESYGSNWKRTGGTFNHRNGALVFKGWSPTLNAPNTTLHKLVVNTPISVGLPGNKLTLAANTTNIIESALVHSNGFLNTGTLILQGDVHIGSTAAGGTTACVYGGGNDQTFFNAGGTNVTPAVIVNKSGGRLMLASPMTYNKANQDMTITAGTVGLAGHALTVNRTLRIGSAATVRFDGTERATAPNVIVEPGATIELQVP